MGRETGKIDSGEINMLNPGYTVVAKKKKGDLPPPRYGFICPECKKVCLETEADPKSFRTKCSNCGNWVYGKKRLENKLE
jgi:hypothetical protein